MTGIEFDKNEERMDISGDGWRYLKQYHLRGRAWRRFSYAWTRSRQPGTSRRNLCAAVNRLLVHEANELFCSVAGHLWRRVCYFFVSWKRCGPPYSNFLHKSIVTGISMWLGVSGEEKQGAPYRKLSSLNVAAALERMTLACIVLFFYFESNNFSFFGILRQANCRKVKYKRKEEEGTFLDIPWW